MIEPMQLARIDLNFQKCILIWFNILIYRGKMPLPLLIMESELYNPSWLLLEVGVAFACIPFGGASHDICTLRFQTESTIVEHLNL